MKYPSPFLLINFYFNSPTHLLIGKVCARAVGFFWSWRQDLAIVLVLRWEVVSHRIGGSLTGCGWWGLCLSGGSPLGLEVGPNNSRARANMDGMCLGKDHRVQNWRRARVWLTVHLLTCFDWCDLCLR